MKGDFEGLDRWELAGQIGNDELVNTLGAEYVSQTPFAYVAQRNSLRYLITNQFLRRERKQHLPGMRGRHQALNVDQGNIALVLTALLNLRLTGVNSHPDFDLRRVPSFLMQ